MTFVDLTCPPSSDAAKGDPLMDRLHALLLEFNDRKLAAIGVTIKRGDDGDWKWVRDAIVLALEREGRDKVAGTVRGFEGKMVSIGISTAFLSELGKIMIEMVERRSE